MIKFDNVTKSYIDGTLALEDINISIGADEFVFLVGPSGSGKTTLMKLLIREEVPTTGFVSIDNMDIQSISKRELPELRRKVGIIFQDFKLLDSKTVFENVAVSLDVVDRPEGEIKQVVPNILNLVNMLGKADCYPEQLSGGERQRVAIARALAHEPRVLIADEPTGNIDPYASDEIVSILDRVNSLGTAVLMATHDKRIVDKMKKRVIRIERGKIVKDQKEGLYEL